MLVLASSGLTRPLSASETITYSYDALGRLVAAQRAGSVNNGQVQTLCYDPAGNRTRYVSNGSGAPASCSPSPTPTPTPTPASFSISDYAATEGMLMMFTVTRSGGSTDSVSWATANGTAGVGDFNAASGTLTFAPGETTKSVTVTTKQNIAYEPDEYFYVNLSGPSSGATIANAQGVGTIYDDD